MRLDQLLVGVSNTHIREAGFLYLERYVNDAKGDFTHFSDVDPRYSPECGMREFGVPFVRVDRDEVTVFEDMPSPEVREAIFGGGGALFMWHPDIPSPFRRTDGHITASPTSSTRTLLNQRRTI